MANPKWFDADVYMQNKLVQMQATDPAYTMTDLVAAFAAAGFVGEEGYFNHFMQFGAAEEVAPNAYFNANEYYAAKAAQFYGEAFTGSELQIAQVKTLINKEGMNAWTHYQQFGSAEGVNPSNAFDAADYCAAKADAMNAAGLKDAAGNAWTAESIKTAIDQAGMSVLEHYLTYAGTGEGEVASGATYPVADDDQVVVPNPGVNILVSESETSYNGTAGDDSFYMLDTAELQAYHTLDGGEGNDTLFLSDQEVAGTIKNIENLVVRNGNDKTYDLSAFSSSFTLESGNAAEAGNAEVTVNNVAGQKLVVANTATVSKLIVNMAADQTSVDLTSQNRDAVQTFALKGDSLSSVKLTVDESKQVANFTGTTATVTDLAITAADSGEDGTATVGVKDLSKLVNITVTGAGKVKLNNVQASVETVNATDNTGGVAVDLSTATKAAFAGGAGADELTIAASTVAHDLGAGDDTVVVDDADVTQLEKGFSVDGGDGEDTLVMSATNAGKMTSDIFKAFTGFEVLGLNDGKGTIKLDSFGDINQVTIAKTLSGEVTIENMDSNGTLEFNAAAGQNITVKVTGAEKEGNITDVLNVKLSAAGDIDNAASDKALTVANVETINIEADDADDDGDAAHTLKLTAEGAKTVNVTGDADLTLSGTFAAGATIDISTNTADVTFTANEIDSSEVTDENTLVTLKGFTDGDTINIANANNDSFGAKVELGANSTIQDYLAAASQSGNAAWFEFGGDTYILFDENNTLDADDYIVKLAGTDYDLKGLSFSSTGDLTLPEGA